MNLLVSTPSMLSDSESLLANLDLLVIGIAIILWMWGILQARRRHTSPKLQLLFTLIMLGGATGDILIRQILSDQPNLTYIISSLLWLAALVVGGLWLLQKKLALAYIIFVLGISLVWTSFVLENRLGEQLFYPVFILGFLLFLSSVLLARRSRKKQSQMGKP